MRFLQSIASLSTWTVWISASVTLASAAVRASPAPIAHHVPFSASENSGDDGSRNVSIALFAELEELARLVDIAYCVGISGIRPPFECVSRCGDFPGYELIDVRVFRYSCPVRPVGCLSLACIPLF
jgi:hypothetical protein